jgi:hypothetical protein
LAPDLAFVIRRIFHPGGRMALSWSRPTPAVPVATPQRPTQLRHAWRAGDASALDRLMPLLYEEPARQAHSRWPARAPTTRSRPDRAALSARTAGKRGGATRAARLRSERRTLAALEHPNIARLLDGGATDGIAVPGDGVRRRPGRSTCTAAPTM